MLYGSFRFFYTYWCGKYVTFLSFFNFTVNSPLLSHLSEAGLLNDLSDLISRTKARDENQLKRYQQQAKDLDTQISYKIKEIDRIKSEVDILRKKRTKCDEEAVLLRRKLTSCSNAMKEIPSADYTNGGGGSAPHSSAASASSPMMHGGGGGSS